MTLFIDGLWILGLILAIRFAVRAWTNPALKDAREDLVKKRRVRIAAYVALVYFILGFLNQIRIPDSSKIKDPTILDFIFNSVKVERTYSAPFASTVTGITLRDNEAELNRVKGIHLLGTDVNGTDILYMVCQGAGTALLLAFGTAAISFPIGVLLGLISGFYGRRIDETIQFVMAVVASIPWILFVVAFLTVFGRGLFWICLAFGLTSWVGTARLIRGETLKQKSLDYVTAARATGLRTFRILLKHILPNVRYLIIIDATLFFSSILLSETILTFIGIGVEQGTTSWGAMLVEAEKELMRSPRVWWVFFGSAFVGLFPLVLSLNILGDALRDALDPRTSSR